MESRPLGEQDSELAAELLRKIYWEARRRFNGSEDVPLGFIFTGNDNAGVQVFLEGEDFTVCYISFREDPGAGVISTIDRNLKPYLADAKPGLLFVSINRQNTSIVEHFKSRENFRKEKEALEYVFSGNEWPRQEFPDNMEERGFSDRDFEDYLWLLDTAYRPVLIRDGHTPDPHRRNLKRTYTILKNAHEAGDFSSFWKGDSIVGTYLIGDNILLEIAVAPVYQGMGIGKAMMSHVLRIMIGERKCGQVLLYVSETNEEAICLYERMGFVRTASHTDFTYLPPSGEETE